MRMSHTILLSLAFTGLAATGVHAQDSDGPRAGTSVTEAALPQADVAAQPEEERLICRREKPIGSNYTKRVCRKASEVETLRNETHGALRNNARATGQLFDVP